MRKTAPLQVSPHWAAGPCRPIPAAAHTLDEYNGNPLDLIAQAVPLVVTVPRRKLLVLTLPELPDFPENGGKWQFPVVKP